MDAISLLRLAFAELHNELRLELEEAPDEWLNWQPAPGMNHIGFLFWHLVRDEDWILPWISKVEPVWVADGWAQRWGLTALEQGTGFDPERAAQVNVSRDELTDYAERVWQRSDELLANLQPEDLEKDLPAGPDLPAYNTASLLTTGCLNHSWTHLGEIRYIKGLKGWRYRE